MSLRAGEMRRIARHIIDDARRQRSLPPSPVDTDETYARYHHADLPYRAEPDLVAELGDAGRALRVLRPCEVTARHWWSGRHQAVRAELRRRSRA